MKATYEIEKKMTASDGPRATTGAGVWATWDYFTSLARAKTALKQYNDKGGKFRLVRVTRKVFSP